MILVFHKSSPSSPSSSASLLRLATFLSPASFAFFRRDQSAARAVGQYFIKRPTYFTRFSPFSPTNLSSSIHLYIYISINTPSPLLLTALGHWRHSLFASRLIQTIYLFYGRGAKYPLIGALRQCCQSPEFMSPRESFQRSEDQVDGLEDQLILVQTWWF